MGWPLPTPSGFSVGTMLCAWWVNVNEDKLPLLFEAVQRPQSMCKFKLGLTLTGQITLSRYVCGLQGQAAGVGTPPHQQ